MKAQNKGNMKKWGSALPFAAVYGRSTDVYYFVDIRGKIVQLLVILSVLKVLKRIFDNIIRKTSQCG